MPKPELKTPPDDAGNGGEPLKGTDPKKPDSGGENFDPSKLGDEDIQKVLEDPRLWKSKRLAELTDKAKKLAEIEQKRADDKKKQLEKDGKYKDLSKTLTKERDDAIARVKELELNQAIQTRAVEKGVKDVDAVLKLIDRSAIKSTEEGFEGVEEALGALLEAKQYLVTGAPSSVGSGTNPASPPVAPGKFTVTQLQDSKFYQENHEEIIEAMRTPGAIIDDRTQPQRTAS